MKDQRTDNLHPLKHITDIKIATNQNHQENANRSHVHVQQKRLRNNLQCGVVSLI